MYQEGPLPHDLQIRFAPMQLKIQATLDTQVDQLIVELLN